MIAALVAAVLVAVGQAAGWRGVDVAAQVYRVDSFRHAGFTLWDFQWYGGHWTLNYSVLYPPLAALLTVPGLAIVSAAVAALGFDRLVRPHLGPGGWAASLVFAAGTLVPAAIGQLTFLLGAALILSALWAAAGRHPWAAAGLAAAAALASPLAGAFLAMAGAAWLVAHWRAGGRLGYPKVAVGLAAAGAVPVLAMAVLFPGQGAMPYPVVDYLWELMVAAGLWLLAGPGWPVVRWGCAVFGLVATVAVAVPSPLGGNVGRLEDLVALPLAVGLVWARRHVVLAVAAVPLVLSQWGPAWGALTAGASQASADKAFFTPLDARLIALAGSGPDGRVEVVPTQYHWEAAYVAPVMPLARGWERQLDVADNPIFYRSGSLTAGSYRSWLLDNGVTFVALPHAPLDMAGQAEAQLVLSGQVPGLEEVWHTPEWALYRVTGSPGIVSSPARLVGVDDGRLEVVATAAATVVIRIRSSPDWTLQGAGCLSRTGGPWIVVEVPQPERFTLTLSLLGSRGGWCPQLASAVHTAVAPKTSTAGPSTQMLIRTNGASR